LSGSAASVIDIADVRAVNQRDRGRELWMTAAASRVLVTGAGVTGGEVLRQLAASGAPARALVRNPGRAEPLRALGVELVEGDFARRESWTRALDGVAKVFAITVPHPEAEAWTAMFLEAARAAGVEHIVQLSGVSVSPASPAAFHRQMARCDDAVRRSGLASTILQPNVFFQNMFAMAGPIRERGRFASAVGEARISMIDVRDVAAVAVRVLSEDGHAGETHAGKTYVLTGPEALSYFDVARLLSEAIGKPVEYQALGEADAVAAMVGLGVPEPTARARVEIHRSFSSGAFTAVTGEVGARLGRPPRTFADFAREHAAAFR
jgi:uncharacterized protein YbjT (DUF2867 family)